ncbi:MAG: glycosyltransferase [Chloroflexales bacterium]
MRTLVIVGGWPKPGRKIRSRGWKTPKDSEMLQPFVKTQVESLQRLGVQCDVWALSDYADGWRKYLMGMLLARRRVSRVSYDLIHAHFGYCGWVARSQRRIPVVISFMGSDLLGEPDAKGRPTLRSRLIVQINRMVARTSDAVIVKSPEMARVIAPVHSYVIPNGVDLNALSLVSTHKARATLGWSEDRYYVLFPNCPEVVRKNFPLAQASVDYAARYCQKPLKMVPLCNVPHAQVPLYMSASDVMVFTSMWEGSPNVVKEAMAYNLPVVSVNVGDVPELLAGVEPSAICSRDPAVLGKHLADILANGERSNGREIIEQRGLELQSVAKKIVGIYEDVLKQRRR